MTNKIKGEVTFEVDGKAWTLCYSVNALCALEEAAGSSATAIAQSLDNPENMRIDTLRTLFWSGLRDHHPETTIEDAGRLMSELGFVAAMSKAVEAFTAAFAMEDQQSPLARSKLARRGKRS